MTDSVTLTVSEETGAVSLAIAGRLYRELDEEGLRNKLIQELVIEEKETTLSFFNKKGGDK